MKNPTAVSIDKKPPQINLYNSVRHSRGSWGLQDAYQQQMMPLPGLSMGFPPMMGAPFYPSGFMNPWSIQQVTGQASQELAEFGVNNGMSTTVCHLSL